MMAKAFTNAYQIPHISNVNTTIVSIRTLNCMLCSLLALLRRSTFCFGMNSFWASIYAFLACIYAARTTTMAMISNDNL